MLPDDPQAAAAPLRILYLEDNEFDHALTAASLAKAGMRCEFVYANCERDFQVALSHQRFDLILSDFALPEYSGLAALQLAQATQPEVPFLLLSGTIGEDRAVEILKAGAADYVLKERLDRLPGAVQRAVREAASVTKRKEAEQSLRESEAKFRQLAENLHQVFFLYTPDLSEIVYVSPAYERVWGRSCQSLYERPLSFLEAIHPEDRERVQATLAGHRQPQAHDEEYRIVRPDGSVRWIHDLGFPVRNEQGEFYRFAGLAEDITERRQLEAQFRQAQKLEAIGQLAAGIAHDFNNLLAVMRGNAEVALMSEQPPEPQTLDCLKEIIAASERAVNLTRQLLLFSRKQVMQPQALQLNEVIASTARMLKRLIGAHINLRCAYGESLPCIHADVGMMEQVLLNLVVNARDAMPQGGWLEFNTAQVHLESADVRTNPEARPGDFVRLTVKDNGQGIASEHLPRIFEPFFTTKEVGKGTGLGLATVYGIIKQHQGWIEVASQPGEGTTFRIFLPALAASQEQPAPVTEEPPLRGGSETILVVEDDLAVSFMTRRVLESAGYQVLEASSGPEALQVWSLHQLRIALLLTDMVMPAGMTGLDVAERLSARQPTLKTIFMSGYSAEITGRDAALQRGGKSAFLQKPFTAQALLETVRRCLESS